MSLTLSVVCALSCLTGAGGSEAETGRNNRYTVSQGDTLFTIADRFYGDGHRWPAIRRANPGVTPERLVPGMVLALPDPAAEGRLSSATFTGAAGAAVAPEVYRVDSLTPAARTGFFVGIVVYLVAGVAVCALLQAVLLKLSGWFFHLEKVSFRASVKASLSTDGMYLLLSAGVLLLVFSVVNALAGNTDTQLTESFQSFLLACKSSPLQVPLLATVPLLYASLGFRYVRRFCRITAFQTGLVVWVSMALPTLALTIFAGPALLLAL